MYDIFMVFLMILKVFLDFDLFLGIFVMLCLIKLF